MKFNVWDYRRKLLHNNDLSNEVHNLQQIDHIIRTLLKVDTIELYPHERRIFYVTEARLFAQTPKFHREWLLKADNIYQTHLKRLASPITYKKDEGDAKTVTSDTMSNIYYT